LVYGGRFEAPEVQVILPGESVILPGESAILPETGVDGLDGKNWKFGVSAWFKRL
jgi:hypothetical protein